MRIEMGAQPRRRQGRHQAWLCAVLGCAGLLGGCSSMNPVNWFHQHEGGEIAKPQQATPGSNQPYPNLATIPPQPKPPNQAELESISNGLIADRAHAQYLAENAPLPDPSSPQASPGLFGIGTAPPPPPAGVATASLPAATAPPAPPAATAPAAVSAPPPAATSAAVPTPAPRPSGPPAPPAKAPVASVESTPLPSAIPAPPPATPSGPAPTIAAAPPPPPPIAPPPAPVANTAPTSGPGEVAGNPANTVEVTFPAGSATLSQPDTLSLKALAARRGGKTIEALGRGDAAEASPSAQETAVTLGFARAQAIAKALQADGVPPNAIQVMSLAGGRGGAAKLVE